MAKNKNKEKPKQSKSQAGDVQNVADNNMKNNQKGQAGQKGNAQGKDFYA